MNVSLRPLEDRDLDTIYQHVTDPESVRIWPPSQPRISPIAARFSTGSRACGRPRGQASRRDRGRQGRNWRASRDGGRSDDPDRRVPIVWKPEDYMIAVSGDPLRNNAYVFMSNGYVGYPTGKKIHLPDAWEQLLSERDR